MRTVRGEESLGITRKAQGLRELNTAVGERQIGPGDQDTTRRHGAAGRDGSP